MAMDFMLKATKKTAQAIRRSMGYMVVLHRHLWLTLTELKDADRRMLKGGAPSARNRSLVPEGLIRRRRMLSSSVPFCERLAVHSGYFALGTEHNRERLHAPVPAQTTPVQWCGDVDSTGTQRTGTEARSSQPPHEASNRSSPAERERESGFYSRYFVVPILDLRPINRALYKRAFKKTTLKQILAQIRPEDWFILVDLKVAYFHIQITPRHRRFLRFTFEGTAYQFTVMPFGLALALCTFTKCVAAALSRLRAHLELFGGLADFGHSEDVLNSHKRALLLHLES